MITLTDLRSALSAHTPARHSVGAQASVLVPVFADPGGLRLLFTKRPESLRSHPGQVSFPGGRIDPSDESAAAAAVREAHEELGIAPHEVELLGQLDDVVTGTGFTVTPFVGWLPVMPVLRPNPAEVEDWFWFPLDRFVDDDSWRGLDITRGGRVYKLWFFDDAPYTIWGATAAMTRQLVELLR